MIIELTTPGTALYGKVADFACQRYVERIFALTPARPDAFAYAASLHSGVIFGCLGLHKAKEKESLLIEKYVPNVFERIAGEIPERKACAELGTRAVLPYRDISTTELSLGLSAVLLLHAHRQGLRYFGFTSIRTVRHLAGQLRLDLITFGKPELSGFDGEFRENWREFFRIRQCCFGFQLHTIDGCAQILECLERKGVCSK
ncbi:MAG: thermostable hemolysin [Candidatus Pacebacteria bacterium]|nr:thermostable hemolysin [Candidatus Paceibacterota bacterium]